jgi:hypothetical protein
MLGRWERTANQPPQAGTAHYRPFGAVEKGQVVKIRVL